MNIVELVYRQAYARPEAVALKRGATVIRFRELAMATNNLATHLKTQGIAPGDRVGVAMGQTVVHVITLLALARLRAVLLPVHTQHPAAVRKAIVDHLRPVTLIASRKQDRVEGCDLLLADPAWLRAPAAGKLAPPDEDAGSRACYFHLSSGSTGTPKAVLRTHENLLVNVLLLAGAFRPEPGTRFVCPMDINVGASLLRLLCYLTAGSAVVFPEKTGWEPIEAILADGQPTHTFISPAFVSRWLRDLGDRRLPAAAFTYMSVGAAPLPPQLRERAMEQITPHVYTTYGTTETSMLIMQHPGDPQQDPRSLGRVVPWVAMQVFDEEDKPLPAGKPGRLGFRGHGFATEYHADPEATARTFRNGWFFPGDIGHADTRGLVYITAREDDMLNIGGLKVMPAESESILAAHPHVAEAATFSARQADGRQRLIAAVVPRDEVDTSELRDYCRERLGKRAPHLVVAVRDLPRDAMGKIVREELGRRFAAAMERLHNGRLDSDDEIKNEQPTRS